MKLYRQSENSDLFLKQKKNGTMIISTSVSGSESILVIFQFLLKVWQLQGEFITGFSKKI
jgi:hypothetical protein